MSMSSMAHRRPSAVGRRPTSARALSASAAFPHPRSGRDPMSLARPASTLLATEQRARRGAGDARGAEARAFAKMPVANAARNLWVTETALTTALNTAYMADRISLFSVVVGVALPIAGFGFGILAVAGALRSEWTLAFFGRRLPKSGPKAVA